MWRPPHSSSSIQRARSVADTLTAGAIAVAPDWQTTDTQAPASIRVTAAGIFGQRRPGCAGRAVNPGNSGIRSYDVQYARMARPSGRPGLSGPQQVQAASPGTPGRLTISACGPLTGRATWNTGRMPTATRIPPSYTGPDLWVNQGRWQRVAGRSQVSFQLTYGNQGDAPAAERTYYADLSRRPYIYRRQPAAGRGKRQYAGLDTRRCGCEQCSPRHSRYSRLVTSHTPG